MPTRGLINPELLTGIADAIRAKNGTSAGMTPAQMAAAISNLELSEAIKQALLNCFAHVAWIDDQGQSYYDALEDALYPTAPPAELLSISAVFEQGQTVIYDTDSLDDLKPMLTVTANYSDSTSAEVTTYTLSGTLTVGTSTITVSYSEKTTTFTVEVTEYVQPVNYVTVGDPTIVDNILTVESGKFVRSNYALNPSSGDSWKVRMKFRYNALPTDFINTLATVDESGAGAKGFFVQQNTDKQYICYVSADGSTWAVSNYFTEKPNLSVDTWYYLEFGTTGAGYFINVYSGGWNGTRVAYKSNNTSTAVLYNGRYVGFGATTGATSGFDGQIDLTDCSIYVNDTVVWTALE